MTRNNLNEYVKKEAIRENWGRAFLAFVLLAFFVFMIYGMNESREYVCAGSFMDYQCPTQIVSMFFILGFVICFAGVCVSFVAILGYLIEPFEE